MVKDEQIEAARRIVPFAFGIRPPEGQPGGLVHNWQTCAECARLREKAIAAVVEAGT